MKDAKRLLTQYSYADRVYLAQREWDAGQVKRARDLLKEAGVLQEELTPGHRPWEWNYLNSVFHPELAVLEGHTDQVWSVAFSPDGSRIATASADNTARLWDAASGKPLAVLAGHTGDVWSVAFSPDGGRVATASRDKTARLWIERESPEDQEKRRRFWREQQAAEAEKSGQWFGAAFHIGRLIDADPANASLFGRRRRAYANQALWARAALDLFLEAASTPAADPPSP